ncbi:chorismate-binding protein [Salegentibacter chungangensis]|uniref:Chorismate-binding protein n=1 Tax=Salegentibacter chungangensis TaxID=1335724 RepID=A0ABW3NRN5_9FLAO
MIHFDEFFVKLEDHLEQQLPCVAYRSPSENNGHTKALLQMDNGIHNTIDYSESGFVFAPFEKNLTSFIIPEKEAEFMETEYPEPGTELRVREDIINHFPPEFLGDADRKDHEELIQKAIEEIEKGKLQKVVLARREKTDTQLTAIEIFTRLLKKYENAFVYLWFHPKTGLWLGATPETLLNVERTKFKTMALAGTQKFKGELEVDWGQKEKEEQQLVTDFILENLKDIATGEITAKGPYTSRAGNLLHIRTDISGYLAGNAGLKELINALHPTPAVCGLPKELAEDFILENEHYDREYYSGFLGELNMKKETKRSSNRRNQENQAYGSISRKSSLYVNLRCMKLEKGKANLYIGGGITKGSDPSDEWEETVNKSYTIKSVLVK